MKFFYRKETNLDNNVEGQHFNAGEEHVISNLELIPREVDLTIWEDFHKINKISDRINEVKKKRKRDKDCTDFSLLS